MLDKQTTPDKRPPADRGQGRKSLKGDAGHSPVLQLRVTPEIHARVKKNGAAWARNALEKAKDPLI